MRLATELRDQIAYQQHLTRLLGWRDAARYRATMLALRAGLTRNATLRLHPPCLLHPIRLRIGSTDADVYHQVLLQQEYAAIAIDTAETIVDCGANAGYTSAFLLSRCPRARLIAIEPFPANAALCRQNLAPYGDRAVVIEAAVWNRPTRLVLEHGTGNEWGVRVRAAAPGEPGDIAAIDIPSLGLERIDILKIDIEASEADLFEANTSAWLPGVRNIAIELHNERCQAIFAAALAGYTYARTQSGELTICRDIRPLAGGAIQTG